MKKHLSIPIILLAFAVVACGKKDNNTVVEGVAVTQPAPYYAPPGSTWTDTNTGTFSSQCAYNGGQMTGNICRFTRNYSNGYGYQYGDYNPGIYVYAGERISISISGSPRVYIGNSQVGTGSVSGVVSASGALSFQRFSAVYSLQSIQVQSCFSDANQRVSCP